MLRIHMPDLTHESVKRFAKNLRTADLNAPHRAAAGILADMAFSQRGVLLPTSNGWIASLPKITWAIGSTGTGKTEVALAIAALALTHPHRRVIILTADKSSNTKKVCEVLGINSATNVEESDGSVLVTLPNMIEGPAASERGFLSEIEAASNLKSETLIIVDEFYPQEEIAKKAAVIYNKIRNSHNLALLTLSQSIEQWRGKIPFAHGADGMIDLNIRYRENITQFAGRFTTDSGKEHLFNPPPLITNNATKMEFYRSAARYTCATYKDLMDRVQNWLIVGNLPQTHQAALEEAARLLGFSNWHSLDGYLKNRFAPKAKHSDPKPEVKEPLPEAYKAAFRALKDQAAAATEAMESKTKGRSEKLKDAQRRIAERKLEVGYIISACNAENRGRDIEDMISIPELTEEALREILWKRHMI